MLKPDTDPFDFAAAVQAEALRRGLARAQKVRIVIEGSRMALVPDTRPV